MKVLQVVKFEAKHRHNKLFDSEKSIFKQDIFWRVLVTFDQFWSQSAKKPLIQWLGSSFDFQKFVHKSLKGKLPSSTRSPRSRSYRSPQTQLVVSTRSHHSSSPTRVVVIKNINLPLPHDDRLPNIEGRYDRGENGACLIIFIPNALISDLIKFKLITIVNFLIP